VLRNARGRWYKKRDAMMWLRKNRLRTVKRCLCGLGAVLVILYIVQVVAALYFQVFPVAEKELQYGVSVEVRRGFGMGLDYVPFFGALGMCGCTHRVAIQWEGQEKEIGIDLVSDLEIENLRAVEQDGYCYVINCTDNQERQLEYAVASFRIQRE